MDNDFVNNILIFNVCKDRKIMNPRHKISLVLKGLWSLFFPDVCLCCGRRLTESERCLCTFCRVDLPQTGQWLCKENAVYELFADREPITAASSFFFYEKEGRGARLVQSIKFRGQRRAGEELGRWYGRVLNEESPWYADADLLIPLPLHPRRRWSRGYNQSECIARGMSSSMGVAVDTISVARCRYTRPQSRTADRDERRSNMQDVFTVVRPERLEHKHVVLVDDVVTTGATLLACVSAIRHAVPSCRISIAALSSSPRRLFR